MENPNQVMATSMSLKKSFRPPPCTTNPSSLKRSPFTCGILSRSNWFSQPRSARAAAGPRRVGRERVDDGAGVRGLGHEEWRAAGLLHGLLQDPRDAQAEQEGALPRQPRRRRGPPLGPAAEPKPTAGQGAHHARPPGRRPAPRA
jgi:hypothetical protein